MLTIQKHFPLKKGLTVGSLALIAGFLSSVTVLNLLDGAQESRPIAQISPADDDQSAVLGESTTASTANKQDADSSTNTSSDASTKAHSDSQVSGLSWTSRQSTNPLESTQQTVTGSTATQGSTTSPSPTPAPAPVTPDPLLPPITLPPLLPLVETPSVNIQTETELDAGLNL